MQLKRFLSWAALLACSIVVSAAMMSIHMPAALLLGPLLTAACFSMGGIRLAIARPLFVSAQSLIGCMIAGSLTFTLLQSFVSTWWLFVVITLLVIGLSSVLGYLLARWRVLPGTTAIWGAAPGGASVMVVLAEEYGSDPALVAFMQYLRVVMVTLAAAGMAHLFLPTPVEGHSSIVWFEPLNLGFAATFAVAALGVLLYYWLKIPGGAIILPMVIGAIFNGFSDTSLQLPEWLLAIVYMMMGWRIGSGFSPSIFKYAAKALPKLVLSISLLISLCGALAFVLVWGFGMDPLTAYLATSPGGLDAIAIIGASVPVDMGFVITFQVARFLMVILVGPPLAKWSAKRLSAAS